MLYMYIYSLWKIVRSSVILLLPLFAHVKNIAEILITLHKKTNRENIIHIYAFFLFIETVCFIESELNFPVTSKKF